MALEAYRSKRDFQATPEPQGGAPMQPAGDSFVIQKHAAQRLHYDLRLEVDGVLRSWAVTRGPSLVAGEKRLAVHVEDHPLEYGDFEGTIPKGEYGGGAVLVWDRGTWRPVGDGRAGYAKGHLLFDLTGEKLGGRWHLVRMAGRPREKRENWLLIKSEDDFARPEGAPDILEERPESVKTGRVIADLAGEEPGRSSRTGKTRPGPGAARRPGPKRARAADLPDFVPPALATLRPEAPTGPRWLHEIKFDGYRLQARIEDGNARLLTRTGLDWTDRFGQAVPQALGALPLETALIDGELVVEGGAGASDFSALQADLSDGRTDRFLFYAFDLLYLDGLDLRETALVERKALLETLLGDAPLALRYSSHFDEEGEMVLRHACRLSLEGVISKLRAGMYRSGRTRDWIKSKCSERQEFVVAGYVPSSVSGEAIGSLVLGHYDGSKLVHAGRVGTGFSKKAAASLHAMLERTRRERSPFAEKLSAEAARQVRFVEPRLVVEVEFRNWTADGVLRHAAFRGIREDRAPEEIVRENPQAGAPSAKPARSIKLTHPDRVYWKDAGVTKEGLADYYSQVWPRIAPLIVSRPLALLRCPQGSSEHCFFQKHAWKGHSKAILTLRDPLDSSDEPIVAIDSLDGLIGLVQGAALEIHPWQASLNELEKPDQIVMDLDPGEGVGWREIVAAAGEVRDRLAEAGLAAFVKTSGGKGLHVVAPIRPAAGWDAVKGFAKAIAEAMAADDPGRFVATVTKSKRGGKILVDYLRNGRGATAVAAYSTRARDGAPVSMPLAWDELPACLGPEYYNVRNAPSRLDNLDLDPWGDFRAAERPIESIPPARRQRRPKAAPA